MQERLEIIDIFRFNRKKTSDYSQQIKKLKRWSYFIIFYCVLAWSLILSTVILDFTTKNAFLKWEEAGVLVMMAMVALIFCSKILSQIQLTRHKKNLLKEPNVACGDNNDFKKLVKKANLRFYPQIPLGILGFIIFISALIITLFPDAAYSNMIWEYAKIAVVLFFGIELFFILKLQKDLKNNITKAEASS